MRRVKDFLKTSYFELKNDFNKIKIEKLEMHKNFSWIMILSSFLFYQIQFYCFVSINNFFLNTLKMPLYVYYIFLDILTLIIVVFSFKDELKSAFVNFKKYFKEYLKYFFYTFIIFAFLNFLVLTLCNLIVGEQSNNQTAIESLNYVYTIFSCLVCAPIVEELIYRGFFRKIIKNDKLFILISGFIFGLAHVIGSKSLIQYIYIIDYSLCGMYLANLYSKYNNIYLNILAHFIFNFMGVSGIVLRLLLF